MKGKTLLTALLVSAVVNLIFAHSSSWAAEDSSAPAAADTTRQEDNAEQAVQEPDTGAAVTYSDYRVTGSALRPRNSGVTFAAGGDGGCMYPTGGSSYVWNTPVFLPQGATVHAMRMYYDDTSASSSSAWFTVYDLYGKIVEEWGVGSVGDTGNGFNDTAVIDHVIDYGTYSYAINWRPAVTGSTMQICGFRIFYEPDPSQNRAVMFPIAVPRQ